MCFNRFYTTYWIVFTGHGITCHVKFFRFQISSRVQYLSTHSLENKYENLITSKFDGNKVERHYSTEFLLWTQHTLKLFSQNLLRTWHKNKCFKYTLIMKRSIYCRPNLIFSQWLHTPLFYGYNKFISLLIGI